jgi:hypothetical protein
MPFVLSASRFVIFLRRGIPLTKFALYRTKNSCIVKNSSILKIQKIFRLQMVNYTATEDKLLTHLVKPFAKNTIPWIQVCKHLNMYNESFKLNKDHKKYTKSMIRNRWIRISKGMDKPGTSFDGKRPNSCAKCGELFRGHTCKESVDETTVQYIKTTILDEKPAILSVVFKEPVYYDSDDTVETKSNSDDSTKSICEEAHTQLEQIKRLLETDRIPTLTDEGDPLYTKFELKQERFDYDMLSSDSFISGATFTPETVLSAYGSSFEENM